MRYLLLPVIFLLYTTAPILGQVGGLVEKAEQYIDMGQLDSALIVYESALIQAISDKNQADIEPITIRLAQLNCDRAEYRQAREILEAVDMTLPHTQFRKLRLLGDITFAINSGFREAIDYYQKAAVLIPKAPELTMADKRDLYFKIAESYNELRDPRKAFPYLEKARAETANSAEPDYFFEAKLQMATAKAYAFMYAFDRAKSLLGKAWEKMEMSDSSLADYDYYQSHLHEIYAYIYDQSGEQDSVLFHTEKEILYLNKTPKANPLSKGQAYASLGLVLTDLGRLVEAEVAVEEALRLSKPKAGKDNKVVAYAHFVKAYLLSQLPEASNEALEYYRESIRIYEGLYGSDNAEIVHHLNNMGALYNELDLSNKALALHRKSIVLANESGDGAKMLLSRLNLGKTLTRLKAFGEAEAILQEGMMMLKQGMPPMFFGNALYAMAMAELKEAQGAEEQAWSYMQRAETVLLFNYGNVHRELAELYVHMAQNLKKRNELDSALAYLQKGENARIQDPDNPNMITAWNRGIEVELANEKASILMARFATDPSNDLLEEAIALYQNAATLQSLLIEDSGNQADIERYSNIQKQTYEGLLNATEALYTRTGNEQLKAALLLQSEKSRAISLRRQQVTNLMWTQNPASDTLLRMVGQKKEQLNYYKTLLNKFSPEDKESVTKLNNLIFTLNREVEELVAASALVNDTRLRDITVPDIETMRQWLPENTTLVEYMLRKERLSVFILDGKDYNHISIPVTDSLQHWVALSNQALHNKATAQFVQAMQHLYGYLIEPALPHINTQRLLVVPDQALWSVNFDLLIGPGKMDLTDFKAINFLIKDYSISYAYSMLGLDPQQQMARSNQRRFMAFAYDQKGNEQPELLAMRSARDINLPGTVLEIRRLNERLKGDLFIGTNASEKAFKTTASDYRILHLALHAEADSLDHEKSKMYFTLDPTDTLEDGLLHNYELYNMSIPAELAVLSACNTGAGTLSAGEGIMSMGRAFQFAGVKSLLLSQWEVSDAVAPQIMDSFYTYLGKGMPKDESLRLAKLNFLENANNLSANPLYWGSFFILGDAQPIALNQSPLEKLWPLLLAFVLVVIGLAVLKRRKAAHS